MKRNSFLLISILLLSMQSFASCPDQLWENYRWANSTNMNEKIKSCIINSESFKESLNGRLCTDSKDNVSDEYNTYLGYKSRFEAKIEERDAAESDSIRRVISSDARAIKNEWIVFGYKNEILTELHLAFKAGTDCFSQHKE